MKLPYLHLLLAITVLVSCKKQDGLQYAAEHGSDMSVAQTEGANAHKDVITGGGIAKILLTSSNQDPYAGDTVGYIKDLTFQKQTAQQEGPATFYSYTTTDQFVQDSLEKYSDFTVQYDNSHGELI